MLLKVEKWESVMANAWLYLDDILRLEALALVKTAAFVGSNAE